MEIMDVSSRFTLSIGGVIRPRRSIILLITGILFIITICIVYSLLGSSFPIVSFFLALPIKAIFVGVTFLLAFMVHRLAWHLAGGLLYSPLWGQVFLWSSNRLKSGHFHLDVAEVGLRAERQDTIQYLVASIISVAAFIIAALLSLGQFLSMETLALFTGLFAAGFGLGARPLIADTLAGINFIFEDNFDIGEKIEIASGTGKIEGIIETMSLQTTTMRAPTGELSVVPNSEVRILRNFSRGRFSTAHLKLKLAMADLERALPLLAELGSEAKDLFPGLLEPWQVISDTGIGGKHTELMVLVKTCFGQGAELRPHLLALIQTRLTEADISLAD